ncbi:MAG TPA: TylF/MycF/NovP-related O-methyltransferase [Burkholderiales bacterium]|nr:TylF/MycF/NovP-related O-methyltransferase [Burkholderiales bacterium]
MANKLVQATRRVLHRMGIDIVRWPPALPADVAEDRAVIERVRPYTMTSPERIHALVKATRHVAAAQIPGAIVECGVWRGGSMMATALTLIAAGDTARELYLFDTFEGMTAPTAQDVDLEGTAASALLQAQSKSDPQSVWCYATEEDVGGVMAATGYPRERIHLVKGKVEETLPGEAPAQIALLRLDTDWYESTRHELEHLFPRLSPGGVLIIDDYGHWAGCRRAVDEYLATHRINLLLNRVDYSGRIAIKA